MDNAITWEDDYRDRANPELFTKPLHDAIPVLPHIDWKVLKTAEGYAKTILPLNYESTNQHGTHQAALIVAKSVIDGATGFPEVENFLSLMEKLGEPFIFGVEDATIYFSSFGFQIARRTPSNAYRRELSDPVFSLYEFFLLRRRKPFIPSTEQPLIC